MEGEVTEECVLCRKNRDVNPLHFSVVPRKRKKKKKNSCLKLGEKKKEKKKKPPAVFNLQASVARCEGFYTVLSFGRC